MTQGFDFYFIVTNCFKKKFGFLPQHPQQMVGSRLLTISGPKLKLETLLNNKPVIAMVLLLSDSRLSPSFSAPFEILMSSIGRTAHF